MKESELLLRNFTQDLSVCVEEELRERWGGVEREAIEKITKRSFEKIVAGHDPIYFLARQVFFDNKAGDPNYLYAPLHKERFAKEYRNYLLDDSSDWAGLLMLVQRESFKSTFAHGVVPLWYALRLYHLYQQHARIALIHQKELQASGNLMRLKAKAKAHPWLKKVWPHFCHEGDFGTKTSFDWKVVPKSGERAEFSMYACGITADLTGLHFDLMCFSDLVVKEHITSKTMRDDTAMRHDALLYTLDMTTGKRIYDGTRYHPNDLYGRMIRSAKRKEINYKVVNIGAGGSGTDEPLSFPTRHSQKRLDAMRAEEMSTRGTDELWWLQMQNRVKNIHRIAADPAWIQFCKLKQVPQSVFKVITVDPAWKGTKNAGEGDYASIQVWGLERRGSLILKYLIDGVHSNMLTDTDGRNEIFRLMKRYGVVAVAPEETGGYSFRTKLMEEAASRGVALHVINLKSTRTGKEQRIVTFLGDFQARRVWICNECDPVLKRSFIDEYQDYPTLDNDDALDCGAYTCDQAIVENYSPVFNSLGLGDDDESEAWQPPPPHRTRYCGT